MKPPGPLDHGCPKWLAKYLESVRQYLVSITPIQGLGITITDQPGGKLFAASRDSGSAVDETPFDVLPSTPGHVRVRWGTVNGIPPAGMHPGDSPDFTLAVASGQYVLLKLDVTFDADTSIWTATGVSIIAGALTAATNANAYLTLGSVGAGGAIASDKRGSLSWERDGDDTDFLDRFQR